MTLQFHSTLQEYVSLMLPLYIPTCLQEIIGCPCSLFNFLSSTLTSNKVMEPRNWNGPPWYNALRLFNHPREEELLITIGNRVYFKSLIAYTAWLNPVGGGCIHWGSYKKGSISASVYSVPAVTYIEKNWSQPLDTCLNLPPLRSSPAISIIWQL